MSEGAAVDHATGSAPRSGWPSHRSLDGGIDRIPLPDRAPAGELLLCGKHVVGPDPEAALQRAGATTVVCLNEQSELVTRYPHYVDWLKVQPTERALWFPVPDLHAPEVDAVVPFLDDLCRRLSSGQRLLVHCGAGIGRAGTVATGVLLALGADLDEALRVVRAHRPMAGPESGAQLELVTALAARFG